MWQNWIRWTAGGKMTCSMTCKLEQIYTPLWKTGTDMKALVARPGWLIARHPWALWTWSWSMEIQVLELASMSKLRVFPCSPIHDHVQVSPYDLPVLFMQVGNISAYPSNCLFSLLVVTFLLSFQENLESHSDNISSSHSFLWCWQCVQSQVTSANSFMTATGYLAYKFSH